MVTVEATGMDNTEQDVVYVESKVLDQALSVNLLSHIILILIRLTAPLKISKINGKSKMML